MLTSDPNETLIFWAFMILGFCVFWVLGMLVVFVMVLARKFLEWLRIRENLNQPYIDDN